MVFSDELTYLVNHLASIVFFLTNKVKQLKVIADVGDFRSFLQVIWTKAGYLISLSLS